MEVLANSIIANKSFIEIRCDKSDKETQSLAHMIPYVHFNRTRTAFRTSPRNIDLVLKLFRGIDWSNVDTLPERVRVLYDTEMKRRVDTKTLLEVGPPDYSGWLYKHQQLGRELAKCNDRFAFFYDTRTGKTPMSLQIIADDIAVHPDHKWLVLCPLILIENAWLPDAKTFFPQLKVVNLHDTTKAKRMKKFALDANVYISNIESFVDYKQHIEMLPIKGCFVDESSTMKSNKSQFGKEAVLYAFNMPKWYLLSGTPAPNGDWEYYRQIQSVDFYGIHQSYNQFIMHFFNNVSYTSQFPKYETKPERKQELVNLLRTCSLYVDKEDVLTTPGREVIPYPIQMPTELKEAYNKFRRELYIETQGKTIVVNSTGGKYNKLNQISSGFVIDTETSVPYLLSTFRIEALDKLLRNIGDEQCLIWANYHEEFDELKMHLGSKCDLVYGKTDLVHKNKAIKDFKDGKIQYLVANPASADKGLTLTNAHFVIYYSMNYSYELWKQSMERVYGDISIQRHKCFYYVIIAEKTIDEVIFDTVTKKGDMSQAMLSHLKGG